MRVLSRRFRRFSRFKWVGGGRKGEDLTPAVL